MEKRTKGERRYGCNPFRPHGWPEDPRRCVAKVWRDSSEQQCGRKRGHGPGGEFCWQHVPGRVTDRAARRRIPVSLGSRVLRGLKADAPDMDARLAERILSRGTGLMTPAAQRAS